MNNDSICGMIQDSQNVFSRLGDELSKKIYIERLLYSMTGDIEHIRNIVRIGDENKSFLKEITSGEKIYMWGAGAWGAGILKVWGDQIEGVVDSDRTKWGGVLFGKTICSPNTIKASNGCKIMVSSRLHYDSICEDIYKLGFNESQIINAGLMLDEQAAEQYLSLDDLPHVSHEVFADIGSLDGKTALRFIDWSGKFSKVYCFEPVLQNSPKCANNVKMYIERGKAEVVTKGVWSSSTVLHFNSLGNGMSSISDKGTEIQTISLDEFFKDKDVTFIKMDIEGAELEALKGARKVITTIKPKLAICIYHKQEDIFTIPQIIMEYNPDYRFFVRHYSIADGETVLYAI